MLFDNCHVYLQLLETILKYDDVILGPICLFDFLIKNL